MKKILLASAAVAALLALASPAAASCVSPLTGNDAGGTSRTFGVTLDASTNCFGNIAVVDGSNAANKATVTAGNALKVDNSAVTQPVSGTIAATQSTSPWVVSGAVTVTGTATVTANAGTNLNTSLLALEAGGNLAQTATDLGPPGATACATDTASCSLNALTQRVAQRLTTVNTTLGTPLQAGGAVTATLGAETTKVIGTVRVQGNVGGVMDAAVAGTYPANALAVGVLNGANIGRLIGDETNGLWVNIKAGAGSGGTAIADKGAWTVSSTQFTLAGGEFTTGGATACTTGQACTFATTATRGQFVDMNTWAETTLGAPSVYGTPPGSVNVIGVNAFVTNATTALPDNVDTVATTSAAANSPVNSYNYLFNGTTFDRQRSGGVTGVAGVTLQATPSGGGTISSAIAPATPAAVVLKASPGTLYGVYGTTIQATPVYIKIYNATSATCGSGTPVARFMLPSNATSADGAGTNVPIPAVGVAFSTGITYCVTGALADADTTTLTATSTLVNLVWN